jgi:hypothetical protein
MSKKYFIDGITQDWLSKPGMVVFVEPRYDEAINGYIANNHEYIQKLCKKRGLFFLYMPAFFSLFSLDRLKYFTGVENSFGEWSTFMTLFSTLPEGSFEQIVAPSLMFTGADNGSCSAYTIDCGDGVADKERCIAKSIEQIIVENTGGEKHERKTGLYCRYVDRIQAELFDGDDDIDFVKEKKDEDIRDSENEHRRCRRNLFPEKEEEYNSARFRVSELFTQDGDDEIRLKKRRTPSSEKEDRTEVLEEDFDSDACQAAQEFIAGLIGKGYSQETIWGLLAPLKELSKIVVTRDWRILLPHYGMEIELPPVQKAVYLLFLRHPEGIYFKDMPDYEEELYRIYRRIAIRGDMKKHESTIAELTNPLGNSLNEKCSIIKKRITALLDEGLARYYYISGSKGEVKRINIKPELICWEQDTSY